MSKALIDSMKNWSIPQVRNHMRDLRAEFGKLNGVERDKRTDEQVNRMKAIGNELTGLRDRLDELQADSDRIDREFDEATGGDTDDVDNPGARPVTSGFQDASGRPIRLLEPKDRLASVHRNRQASDGRERVRVGNMLKGALTGDWNGADAERQMWNALATTSGSSVMIPETISAEIFDLARAASSVVAAGARTLEMTSPYMRVVRVVGDPTIAQVDENTSFPESDPSVDGIDFVAVKHGVIVRCSRELLQDAVNVEVLLENVLGSAMGSYIDSLALAALLADANINGIDLASATPTYDTLIDAVAAVEEANGKTGAILWSPAVKSYIAKLKNTVGDYLAEPPSLSDVRKLSTKKMADDAILAGDFAQLLLGVWKGVVLDTSDAAGASFENDQVLFRVKWRGHIAAVRPTHFTAVSNVALS